MIRMERSLVRKKLNGEATGKTKVKNKMPNWSYNEVTVIGEPEVIDKIEKLAFDFNRIIPVSYTHLRAHET